MKTPNQTKKQKTHMLNGSHVLEQLPKEINAEPGKGVKFVLWLFIGRREVTHTGFGHPDTVGCPNPQKIVISAWVFLTLCRCITMHTYLAVG